MTEQADMVFPDARHRLSYQKRTVSIMDYSIKIGGAAGQGIQTIGETLARVFARSGFHVFSHQDYESRIRGGHNFYQLRLADKPITSSKTRIDIIVALDTESIVRYEQELTDQGRILYDSAVHKVTYQGTSFHDIPFEKLAQEHGGSKIVSNTVATGAVLGMLGLELTLLFDIISASFAQKGDAVISANTNAAQAGYDHARHHCTACPFSLPSTRMANSKFLISGVEALAFGAIASGCKFYSGYPMTPSTGIMNYLASKEKEYHIVVEQAEDELAAINMVIGASFAGVRAMTGTSGGGFSLMAEGVSLAGMTETPVVIAMGQRPGPATGFPTRTEQSDLLWTLYAGHGEFLRIVLAPGTPKQAFYLMNKAFNIAEKYQVPAIVLFDTYLADSQWTFDGFDVTKLQYQDYRLRGEAFSNLPAYKRHAFTPNGISLFGIPGDANHTVVTDSDEHDEEGHIVEDAPTRVKMMDKRYFKKLALLREEISPPFFYGERSPQIILTGWGSTYGVMRETVDRLSASASIAMLHFSELYPLPQKTRSDYLQLLSAAKLTICLENNASGQFARLMRAETGYNFTAQILKFDGRPFSVDDVIGEINGYVRSI
jgi:2-oxoglutarate/2-oxoacid ferredoxin oxidoreductase subunit alpha